MIIAKIEIEPAVAEYVLGKYYDAGIGAVKFPPSSEMYITIYNLMAKRPADKPVDSGNLPIALPDRRAANEAGGKDPQIYNYLSARAAAIIGSRLSVMMWAELHERLDEDKHLRGIRYKDSVFEFMQKYGIESITEDALLKNYQRWRDKIRRRLKRGYTKKQ